MTLPQTEAAHGAMPLEIERKFLIEYPDPDWLAAQPGSRRVEIVQTYLHSDGGETRRVRSWAEEDRTDYIFTRKHTLTDRTRVERETPVTREEYLALLEEADPSRHPIEKVRWCLPWGSHVLEIDLYPFWTEQAVLEVELESEEEEFELPERLRVIREVTGDPRYLNSSLARELP